VGAEESVVVDCHGVGGGEGLESSAAIEGVVGNRFDIARHCNTVQQRAAGKPPIAERREG